MSLAKSMELLGEIQNLTRSLELAVGNGLYVEAREQSLQLVAKAKEMAKAQLDLDQARTRQMDDTVPKARVLPSFGPWERLDKKEKAAVQAQHPDLSHEQYKWRKTSQGWEAEPLKPANE